MSTFPSRMAHTFWHNPEPFTDIHEALDLLNEMSPTYEPMHLDHCWEEGFEWEIVAPWYFHGSSGGDQSGHYYYQIHPALAKRLVEEEFVEKRTLLYPGYTETRENEFVISEVGKERLAAFHAAMRAKSEDMLIPGVHTDLTGTPAYRGRRREGWHCGRVYCEFELPTGGRCRVYPEENRIELPDEAAAAA